MSIIFAAGLFDNPWVVVVIVIISALANWLSKRRQDKQVGPPSEDEAAAATPPRGDFDLEEVMRRVMGESPASGSAPPPLPYAGEGELPSIGEWPEESPFQPTGPGVPALGRPIVVTRVSSIATGGDGQDEPKPLRYAPLNEGGRPPGLVVGRGIENRSRAGGRGGARWREARSARQAFVAAVVFAPPKSLEF